MESSEPKQQLTRYERYKHIILRNNKTYREKNKDNPIYLEKRRMYDAQSKRNKYQNDPEYREKIKQRNIERYYAKQLAKVQDCEATQL